MKIVLFYYVCMLMYFSEGSNIFNRRCHNPHLKIEVENDEQNKHIDFKDKNISASLNSKLLGFSAKYMIVYFRSFLISMSDSSQGMTNSLCSILLSY